jgi:hypothetical protein
MVVSTLSISPRVPSARTLSKMDYVAAERRAEPLERLSLVHPRAAGPRRSSTVWATVSIQ